MKRFSLVMCLLVMMFSVMPVVRAEEKLDKKSTKYGDIYIDETPPDSATKKVVQAYSITKTLPSGYVYMKFVPTKNVSNVKITLVASSFEKVNEKTNSDGSVSVLFKTKSGAVINGTKTELVTITADANDAAISGDGCILAYNPLSLDCSVTFESEGLYFDNSGNKITKADYETKCKGGNGTTTPNPKDPDVPNPKTGEVVPYAVIGGGLAAVLVVYLFSRKSNKMYKL